MYGFGARLPPNGIVSHDFAVVSQTDYIEKPSENTSLSVPRTFTDRPVNFSVVKFKSVA